jgi:hypothetical protein
MNWIPLSVRRWEGGVLARAIKPSPHDVFDISFFADVFREPALPSSRPTA